MKQEIELNLPRLYLTVRGRRVERLQVKESGEIVAVVREREKVGRYGIFESVDKEYPFSQVTIEPID